MAASVGLKKPPTMPYRMSTVSIRAQKAPKNSLRSRRRGTFSPLG
jgi:hypothetical protein